MALCCLPETRGTGWPTWLLFASLCSAPLLTGRETHTGHMQPPPPRNVTLLSKAFDMILTWMPGEGSPPDVRYTVRYESEEHTNKWKNVHHCKNIQSTSCNLTCLVPKFFPVRARVKAVSGPFQSPWVESQSKEYHRDVELAPPALNVYVEKNLMHVNASFPLAACVESLFWMYDLDLWEVGSEYKKQYRENFRKETVTIHTTTLRGNYCLSARSSYQITGFKHSEFSRPVCVLLNQKAVQWKFPFSAMIPVFVLPIFVTSIFIACLLKQDAKGKELPRALDLSPLKAAGPACPCELSEKELFRDYLICTEKPVSQRMTNTALARTDLPRMAPFLSSSSLEEEEEEDEEDSSTFIPYTEMPQFPKRHLSCPPSRAAQGETSLDSGSEGLSVDSESVPDLSTLGFSFFPVINNARDASGCQGAEQAALSHSSSLGGISLTDVGLPGPREHWQHDTDGGEHLEMTLTERICDTGPAHEHYLPGQAHHFTTYCQTSIADLQVRIGEMSQLSTKPSTELLISFQTLQVAEDEGIASDCDSDNLTEGTPPAPTVLSDAFKNPSMEEKYDQKFQFKGLEHPHYMRRT